MTFSKQETLYSCGCAAIRNCLKSFGEIHSERKIRNLTGTSRNGTNGKQLKAAITAIGYNSKKFTNKNQN